MSALADCLRLVSRLIRSGFPTPAETTLRELIHATDAAVLREHEQSIRSAIAEFFVPRQRAALTDLLTSRLPPKEETRPEMPRPQVDADSTLAVPRVAVAAITARTPTPLPEADFCAFDIPGEAADAGHRTQAELQRAEAARRQASVDQGAAQEGVEEKEFRQLVEEMSALGFTHSKQVSEYIVGHRLGHKYKHISGILQMELDGDVWDFNGGFPPKIYARLCSELGLGNQGSRAKPKAFTPYKDIIGKEKGSG